MRKTLLLAAAWLLVGPACSHDAIAETLERLPYNHPGLVVDLGVGLWVWPMPVDWDGDGRRDLLIGAEDGFLYFLVPARHAVEAKPPTR